MSPTARTRATRSTVAALLVCATVLVGGCGDDEDGGTASASSPDSPSTTATTKPSTEPSTEPGGGSDDGPGNEAVEIEIEIEIENGQVTPAGDQVDATVGDEVVLEVDSDAADELHVHSAPEEHEFEVQPRDDQRFRFTVEQPGQFDIELHDSDTLVAQLVVQP